MSELTYERLTRELFPRLTGGIRWGLERIQELLDRVGNPQHAYRSVHVGGTNGKGSVAAILASILRADGCRTGLYSSPHLCTFRERIQVDGVALSEADLLAAAHTLWPHIEKLNPSFFEATTAIGFLALAEAGVDVAVVEVGLGGRLDATNVISPDLAIITNIALDHAEYLGDTLESIAREKAGIIKAGVPIVTGERSRSALRIFMDHSISVGASLHVLDRDEPGAVEYDASGTRCTITTSAYGTLALSCPLIGYHQAANAALAVHGAALLPAELQPRREAVIDGVASVRWPGRLQLETIAGQQWVFDVAHNAAGVHALVNALSGLSLPKPLVLVVGILGDKDWKAMLPPLFDLAALAVLTVPPTAPSNRGWQPREVLQQVPFEHAVVIDDFPAALKHAAEHAREGTVLVTGSFHTVGDALITLERTPFGSDVTLPRLVFSA